MIVHILKTDQSLTDSEVFILFAKNSQILLKISVIPFLLTFIYVVALICVNTQLNSSLRHIIVTMVRSWIDSDFKKYLGISDEFELKFPELSEAERASSPVEPSLGDTISS